MVLTAAIASASEGKAPPLGPSNVNLFIIADDPHIANTREQSVVDAITRKLVPGSFTVFRTSRAITVFLPNGFPNVQIILQLASSPYAVVSGFNLPPCKCLYDGFDCDGRLD
jgi:hypothetical protein